MSEKIFVTDWDESLAAVKFKGHWRFFHDVETAFLLNYSAYDDRYTPKPGGYRYGTLVVDKNNADEWMKSLAHEVSLEQLPHLYWQDSEERVRLTFVIDFDKKLWVGSMWKMDQSPLTDYQPQGWTAIEDDVKKYLPSELVRYFE